MKTNLLLWVAATTVVVLAGCTHVVSRQINEQGVPGTVVFPDPHRDLVLKEGIFPNLDNLRLVKPGVSKDQLYYLLGRPHFREGLYGVREWDYLFHFRTAAAIRTCQYKVIFDRDYRGQSFHWQPEDCVHVLDAPTTRVPTVVNVEQRRVELVGDGLFTFGQSGIGDLSPAGREQLDRIAAVLVGSRDAEVEVQAHTDRIGSEAANLALSQARADSVRDYLASKGVPAGLIRAVGMGESQPVKTCDDGLARQALIACLAPNRRVVVRAAAKQ